MKDSEMEQLLDSLGWEGQIGQMAQIDINMLLTDDHTELRQDLLDHYIGSLGVGSVLNNQNQFDPMWTMKDFRKAVVQIQQTAKKFNRPPVIWGLDSVHGANYIYDTVITPQPINLAASFDPYLAYQAGAWASRDTRRAGIPWLFSPLVGLSWNPFWSRVYETFGEDPLLVGSMALAMTNGIQDNADDGIIPSKAAACGKHFIGYSNPHNGHDRSPSAIPRRQLYQYFVLPWKKVIGTMDTVMESYTETDGVPNVANRQALNRLLRKDLEFNGLLVTDYHEIFNLFEWHHTAGSRTDALQQALMEGSVDMSMIANEPQDYFKAFSDMDTTQWSDRIRASARRVLQLKKKLNMFEESFDLSLADSQLPGHSKEDIQLLLNMTAQSIPMVKNDKSALPLDGSSSLKVMVTGPTANSKSFTTGGWTWQWQGVDSHIENKWFTYGSSIVEASQKESNWDVSYFCGVDVLGLNCDASLDFQGSHQDPGVLDRIKGWVGWNGSGPIDSVERAMQAAAAQDVIIICVGEENYTEKPGDIRDLRLPDGQYELVAGLREAAPDAKIVLIYFGGRPRLLKEIEPFVDSIFIGLLPGPLAGDALVDLITGRSNPSAKLPITYPKYQDGGGVPYLHAVSDMCTKDTGVLPHWENTACEVQWHFGHGMSYSTFEYQSVTLSDTELKMDNLMTLDDLLVTVKVKNTSDRPGAFPILVFSFDSFRSTTPEYKRLRAFDKIFLGANESRDVDLTIKGDDLRIIGNHDNTHYTFEDGLQFVIGVGSDVDCRMSPGDKKCSTPVTIQTHSDYVASCEAACNLWSRSGCYDHADLDTNRCWEMCTSIHFDKGLEMNNDGWGWNYVECLESIVWEDSFNSAQDCWKLTSLCRDVIATPLMDEYGNGLTPEPFLFSPNGGVVLGLALVSGLFASLIVLLAMRGGFRRRKNEADEIQFSAIRTHDAFVD